MSSSAKQVTASQTEMPGGTVTLVTVPGGRVIRVLSEDDPDPGDWEAAMRLVRQSGGRLLEVCSDGPVTVFEISGVSARDPS